MRLPAGRSSTSTPGSPPSSSGSTSRSRPSPPGKSVDATSSKCSATAANVSAKRRSTVAVSSARSFSSSSRLRSRSSRCVLQVVEPLLLRLVLLARERIDLAERRAARLEPLDARRELVAVVALGRLDVARGLEPPRRVGASRRRSARSRPRPPSTAALASSSSCRRLDLGRAERPQLLAELARPHGARVDARAERRLEARRRAPRRRDAVAEPRSPSRRAGASEPRVERRPREARGACAVRGLGGACPLRRLARRSASPPRLRRSSSAASAASAAAPSLQLEQHGLGGLAREPELAATGVVAEALGRHGRSA